MSTEITIDAGDSGPSINLDADDQTLLDEISIRPAEKTITAKPKPSRPLPFARRVPRMQEEEPPLEAFMNPDKRTAPSMPTAEEWDGEEDGEAGPEEGQYQGGGGPQMPSEGYKSIEDEKADLLNKISRLAKKGLHTNARLTSYSDIEEIRTEYKRLMYGIEVDRSIKFQRRMLIATVTGLEFLNKKFDPFDLQLDGWSENMMENVDDYDGVFEDLHNKYKNKIEVAPEVKLIMMVGGSAMMFHLTNSMFKAAMPNMNQVVRENPDLVKNMMDAVQKTQNAQMQGPPQPGLRREMQGPGLDISSLMGMMGPPPPQIRPVGPRMEDTESVSDIVSLDAGDDTTRDVTISGDKPKRGRKPKSNKKEVTL
jgi:Family of unknown function (DUF5767)